MDGSGRHCCFLYHPPKKFKSAAVHRYIIILCATSSKKIKNFEGSKAKKIPIRQSRQRKQVSGARGEVLQAVVVIIGVVGLRRVDDEQAGSPNELFGCGEERSGSSSRFWGFWPRRGR